MRTISLTITTWKRFLLTIRAFEKVFSDPRISEITITDDASDDNSYENLKEHFKHNEKVKIFKNETNLDCYRAKNQAMLNTEGKFTILFDSDNILTPQYLDAIYAIEDWDEKTIYQPSFAKPHFNFTKFSGLTLTKENINQYLHTNLETAMNAMNFFINREEYLRVWDGSLDPITSDSIFFSYTWLKAGNKIYITPNLEYDHQVGNGHYTTNSHRAVGFHKELLQKFKQLT